MIGSILLLAASAAPAWADYFPDALTAPLTSCRWADGRLHDVSVGSRSELTFLTDFFKSIGEPPLYHGERAVRFTWSRTFNAPIVIRAELPPTGPGRLFAKRLSGQGGYGWGTVKDSIERSLTSKQIQRIVALMHDKTAFPPPPLDCRPPGLDGAGWTFEGEDVDGAFRFANLDSPNDGVMRDIGLALIEMSGWANEEVY